jgi:luciferase-type oxidoreductase
MPTSHQADHATSSHPAFKRLFLPKKLTFGFIAPIAGYPDTATPGLTEMEKIVRLADELDLDAIWLRDVPFLDPNFGDAGQVFDAMVYAGWLAAITKQIFIGTAGIVLPLRDPVIIAKQAATVDQLSGGRMILGLASGDRASEYPAFGADFNNRDARFREAKAIITTLLQDDYPSYASTFYGTARGNLDLIPKPAGKMLPTISIGRGGQSLEWIANNMDGWIWHGADASRITDVIPQWEVACGNTFKPFGYGTMFDLSANPNDPVGIGRGFVRGGRNGLINFWQQQQEAGLSHIAINMKPTRRPAEEILHEFAEFIIPQFR